VASPGNTSSVPSPSQVGTGLIAPGWHTVVVVIFLLSIAALEAWSLATSPDVAFSSRDRIVNYTLVLAWEWPTVAFIAWGVRKRGHRLRDLIAGRWPTVGAFWRDLGIGVLFLLGAGLILGLIRRALGDLPTQAVRNLLPDSLMERALWVVLSATAGFCEETIFRGYLQKQFARLTGNTGAGIVLQAIVFGACHGYQGLKSMISIAFYGFLFGLLANHVQNLRPGMLAHFLQDSVAGLAGRAILKRFPAG